MRKNEKKTHVWIAHRLIDYSDSSCCPSYCLYMIIFSAINNLLVIYFLENFYDPGFQGTKQTRYNHWVMSLLIQTSAFSKLMLISKYSTSLFFNIFTNGDQQSPGTDFIFCLSSHWPISISQYQYVPVSKLSQTLSLSFSRWSFLSFSFNLLYF